MQGAIQGGFNWLFPEWNALPTFDFAPVKTPTYYGGHILKQNPSVIYVKLYGGPIHRSQRFSVMNALENYFCKYGKIGDVGKLKSKYSDLGDFFIVFKNEEDAMECSNLHSKKGYYSLSPAPQLEIGQYWMKVW